MKLVREYFIQEVTYKYDSEKQKEIHKTHMISKGFTVSHTQRIFDMPLSVTYQKRQLNDNVARL